MVSSAARPRPSLKTLWQKIESSPLPETEESIILRILGIQLHRHGIEGHSSLYRLCA